MQQIRSSSVTLQKKAAFGTSLRALQKKEYYRNGSKFVNLSDYHSL